MARYYPPEQIPIAKLLEIARKIRVLADKIESSSQDIAKTDFKEPWIFSVWSAEKAIEQLQGFSAALFAQQTKMEMGDPGGPIAQPEKELSEKAKKTLKSAQKALKPKKKPPEKRNP